MQQLAMETWKTFTDKRCDFALDRVRNRMSTRTTRAKKKHYFSPSDVQQTLITNMTIMWNMLPDDVRVETKEQTAKHKIRELVPKMAADLQGLI